MTGMPDTTGDTPTHDAAGTAALAKLLLRPEDTITRVTVSLSYPGTRDFVRRTTLDLQMPEPGSLPHAGNDLNGTPLAILPVGYAYRGQSLVNFSLCDETGTKLSLLTRSENEDLTEAVLLHLLPDGLCSDNIGACTAALARTDTSDDSDETLKAFLTAVFDHNEELARSTFADPNGALNRKAELFTRLSASYLLFARVPDRGHRTIITWKSQFVHDTPRVRQGPKSSYSHKQRQLDWWDRKKERLLLRWPRLEAEFPLAFAQSVHLEVELPDGVVPVEPEFDGEVLPDPMLRERHTVENREEHGEWEVSIGDISGSRIHIASTSNRPRNFDGQPYMLIRPARWSWLLPTAALTAITLAIATLTALPDWSHALGSGWEAPEANGDETPGFAATGLIAAVVSLAIGIVSRRDEHELVNRVQGRHRPWMAALAALLLAAAIFSTLTVPWLIPLTLWTATALAAGALLVVQVIGWRTRRLPPEPRKWRWLYLTSAAAATAAVTATVLAQPLSVVVLATAISAPVVEAIARVTHFYVRQRTST